VDVRQEEPVDFEKVLRERFSCRDYSDRPVEDEKLQAVLEAARLAPTAANRQPFRLVVIRDGDVRDRLDEVYPRHWFYSAPVVICACGLQREAWARKEDRREGDISLVTDHHHRHYTDVDVALAMDHLILQATALGLATCLVADFDVEAARRVVHLPHGVEPILFTPLGYPAEPSPAAGAKKRRPLEELVHWNRFAPPA
jgi:nitroreductase